MSKRYILILLLTLAIIVAGCTKDDKVETENDNGNSIVVIEHENLEDEPNTSLEEDSSDNTQENNQEEIVEPSKYNEPTIILDILIFNTGMNGRITEDYKYIYHVNNDYINSEATFVKYSISEEIVVDIIHTSTKGEEHALPMIQGIIMNDRWITWQDSTDFRTNIEWMVYDRLTNEKKVIWDKDIGSISLHGDYLCFVNNDGELNSKVILYNLVNDTYEIIGHPRIYTIFGGTLSLNDNYLVWQDFIIPEGEQYIVSSLYTIYNRSTGEIHEIDAPEEYLANINIVGNTVYAVNAIEFKNFSYPRYITTLDLETGEIKEIDHLKDFSVRFHVANENYLVLSLMNGNGWNGDLIICDINNNYEIIYRSPEVLAAAMYLTDDNMLHFIKGIDSFQGRMIVLDINSIAK